MKLFLILLLTIGFSMGNLFGQVEYEKRVEIAFDKNYTNNSFSLFGENGLLLKSKRKGSVNGQTEWKYQRYNTELEKDEECTSLIDKNYFLDLSVSTDDRHFMLFNTKKDNFILQSLEIKSMEISKVEGKFPWANIVDMFVLGDYAFLKAFSDGHTSLITVNWKTGESEVTRLSFDGYTNKETRTNFQVLKEKKEVLIYVLTIDDWRKSSLHVYQFDNNGNKKGMFKLTKKNENNILDTYAGKVGENQHVFTGLYSTRDVGNPNGLFFSNTTDEAVNYLEFYNFSDLDKFGSYMPQKNKQKEEETAEEDTRGYAQDYKLAEHEIVVLDDGYLFIGEAYYPTYRSDGSGGSYFSGYQYTHAIIAKFSKDGKLQWNKTLKMLQESLTGLEGKKYMKVSVNEKGVKLVYPSVYKMVSKHIDYNGKLIEDMESEEVEVGLNNDKTNWPNPYITPWYDDYFIANGYKKKRVALFFNKLKF